MTNMSYLYEFVLVRKTFLATLYRILYWSGADGQKIIYNLLMFKCSVNKIRITDCHNITLWCVACAYKQFEKVMYTYLL